MITIVKLTLPNGAGLYLNEAHIVAWQLRHAGASIELLNGSEYHVKETVEEISKLVFGQ